MHIPNDDLKYLINKMSEMSTLPIRVFNCGKLSIFSSILPLRYDPFNMYRQEIFNKEESVTYFTTPDFDNYGIINSGDIKIVIGPSRQYSRSKQDLNDLAYELNVSPEDTSSFIESMKVIAPLPLNFLLEMLCTFNYLINGEKINPNDFNIENTSTTISEIVVQPDNDVYRTYNIEKEILGMVKKGDIDSFNKWISNVPSFKPGKIADNALRHHKNTFIVTTTLVTRTAISAGVDIADAFKLSDYYIQKCESLTTVDDITALQFQMVTKFTNCVSDMLNAVAKGSDLQNRIYFYVVHNISSPITTEEIATHLYMSRSHLSTLFKKDTGISLSDYIHQIKINKAKELLLDFDKNITLISNYLGYSSSSHFSKVFKRFTGVTPLQYRKNAC